MSELASSDVCFSQSSKGSDVAVADIEENVPSAGHEIDGWKREQRPSADLSVATHVSSLGNAMTGPACNARSSRDAPVCASLARAASAKSRLLLHAWVTNNPPAQPPSERCSLSPHTATAPMAATPARSAPDRHHRMRTEFLASETCLSTCPSSDSGQPFCTKTKGGLLLSAAEEDWNLPAPLSRARVVRLQPAPAAAPADQPYHPDSSRLVCHSRSGPLRAGTPPSHHDRGDKRPSVLALIGAWDARLACGDSEDKTSVRAWWLVLWLSPSVFSSRFPQARYSSVVCLWVSIMPWKRKKCWTAETLCRLDASFSLQYDSELDLGSPEAPVPRDEESTKENRPFLPRFLLQEIIFAHSPYERVFPNRPSLQGNFLCKSDWLRLRGIAETDCMILPVRELAAYHQCSVCEQLNAGERPSARSSLSAPALLDEFRWQSDSVPSSGSLRRADSPCSGRTDSIYDSDSVHWKLRREADAELSQSSASAQCPPLFLLCARFRHECV